MKIPQRQPPLYIANLDFQGFKYLVDGLASNYLCGIQSGIHFTLIGSTEGRRHAMDTNPPNRIKTPHQHMSSWYRLSRLFDPPIHIIVPSILQLHYCTYISPNLMGKATKGVLRISTTHHRDTFSCLQKTSLSKNATGNRSGVTSSHGPLCDRSMHFTMHIHEPLRGHHWRGT